MISAALAYTGSGGANYLGGQRRGPGVTGSAAGGTFDSGNRYGCGGGAVGGTAATTAQAGGDGHDGLVIVTVHF
ncbi:MULTISPECIES: hypothetical protein [Streptomyces]|uniref:Uncharacterized protein n=1 Tax=Streptomyces albidocamelliae TaxID=2981135 RepID=A0ABY6EHI2_9ACTN|nr:hypothetical protein [Streptomyces sp. HUAS 14-6]UXY34339.1 hypothetical protein N8I86_06115 [Streptomyces sp. HUAS 14-6]